MKKIEFFFHKNLDIFINQERLDLILIFLAFEQEIILNIDNQNKSRLIKEVQKSLLNDYLENPNFKLYFRNKEEHVYKSDVLINCVN